MKLWSLFALAVVAICLVQFVQAGPAQVSDIHIELRSKSYFHLDWINRKFSSIFTLKIIDAFVGHFSFLLFQFFYRLKIYKFHLRKLY